DQAGMHARSALALLENSGHEQSALLADSREFLGELACIRGDWGAGAQALAAARSYWTEIGGVPEVVRDLERRLAVCGPRQGVARFAQLRLNAQETDFCAGVRPRIV